MILLLQCNAIFSFAGAHTQRKEVDLFGGEYTAANPSFSVLPGSTVHCAHPLFNTSCYPMNHRGKRFRTLGLNFLKHGRNYTYSIPKKGSAKECSNYCTVALISHASKLMLKILQSRLQQYVNCELPDVQASFRKGRGTRDQIANIHWIIKKAREFQKNIYFCFIDYAKAFDCVDHNKLWKILKEVGIQDHLTCLMRNLYAGQEATVTTGHRTTDWFEIGKGVGQGCIFYPAYLTYMQRTS